MPEIPHPVDKFKLKIFFLEDKSLSANVIEVVVDTNVFMPAMFTVVIEDTPDPLIGILQYLDVDPRFQIGAKVSIGFEAQDQLIGVIPISNNLLEGEITSIEPIFMNGRTQLRIRGYDKTHRLMRGKKTRAFQRVTEMMLITKIASESGMTPVISGKLPTTMFDYVLQNNQTNWDFLSERAQLYGYQFYADGVSLMVSGADSPRSLLPVDMSWGGNLNRFEPRLVSMGQATSTTVMGWNPEMKMPVMGMAAASVPKTKIGEIRTGSITAMTSFGKADDVFPADKTISSMSEAMTIAQARFDENQSEFVKASGELIPGNPNLVAGSMALIHGVGTRFSGSYYITEARHIWNGGEYKVQFQVTGRNPYTIRHLLGVEESKSTKIDGVVVAKVTNNTDMENLARVKVSFPWMPKSMGGEVESCWARLAAPSAGANRGILFIPEVNDEVLVAFENGDINSPYIVGQLWNKLDRPPKGTKPVCGGGKINQRIVCSRSGHVIILDDTAGAEQIIIKDKTDKNSIIIDSTKNAMTIKSMGDLTIDAGGKLTISSKGDFSIKSTTKGTIEAMQSTLVKAGSTQLDLQVATAALKSTKVDVQAQAQASIQGNAMVQIQGAIVKIN